MENTQEIVEVYEKSIPAVEIEIITFQDYEKAGWMLKNLKSFIKNIDDKRKELTKPLDESKKKIMAMFNPVIEKAEKCEKDIKSKMLVYMNKVEEEKKKAEHEALKDGKQVVIVQEPKMEGIKKIKVWKALITDISIIPRDFLIQTDKQKEALQMNLNAIARQTNNAIKIPGVKFYEEETLSSTRAWDA